MSGDNTKVHAVTLAILAGASMTGAYIAANGTGFSVPLKVLYCYNGTNQTVLLSLDGTNNHFVLPAGGTFVMDCEANGSHRSPAAQPWRWAKNQIIYANAPVGTGSLYIGGFY